MNSVDEILARPYSRLLTPDPQGGFTGEIREFPGCVAEGETADEAYAALEAAARDWIAAAIVNHFPILPPVEEPEASGRLALRMPKSLHGRAARAAEQDGVSLNQFICCAVAERIGERTGQDATLAQVRQEVRSLRTGVLDLTRTGRPDAANTAEGTALAIMSYGSTSASNRGVH